MTSGVLLSSLSFVEQSYKFSVDDEGSHVGIPRTLDHVLGPSTGQTVVEPILEGRNKIRLEVIEHELIPHKSCTSPHPPPVCWIRLYLDPPIGRPDPCHEVRTTAATMGEDRRTIGRKMTVKSCEVVPVTTPTDKDTHGLRHG